MFIYFILIFLCNLDYFLSFVANGLLDLLSVFDKRLDKIDLLFYLYEI